MNSKTSVKIIVYNFQSYISRQPGHLRVCPDCGKEISVLSLPASRVVDEILTLAVIPCHEFTVLYQCEHCHWWAIRESWSDCEGNYAPDCLVVPSEKSLSDANQQAEPDASPWNLLLQDEHLYDKVIPLPENLGKLFT